LSKKNIYRKDGRVGGVGKMSTFIGEGSVYKYLFFQVENLKISSFNLSETRESQQFPMYNCAPGNYIKLQFSDFHTRTSQYGREIFKVALQKVVFNGNHF
jgi:hypothetical protein